MPAWTGPARRRTLTALARVQRGDGFNAVDLEGPMVTRHLAILADAYPPAWAHAAYRL
jgi:hypothetical protein